MDLDLVKKIIKIAEETDISGLAVEQDGFRVEVKREKQVMAAIPQQTVVHQAAPGALSKPKEEEEEG
ncbi:MAG: hypothetical protein ABH860_00770, partial [bacterium]